MAEVKKSDKNYWLEILLENNPYERTKYYEALVYVRKNFMEFYPDDKFLELNLEIFSKLLESDDLGVENEEVVFDSVRRWLKFNSFNLELHLKPLLKLVRLSLLPAKYLLEVVEPYVNRVPNCREEFLDVLRYHLLGEKITNTTLRVNQNIFPKNSNMKSNCVPKPSLKFLAIGSRDMNTSNIVEIYDGDLNTWTKLKNRLINRKNYAVALINNQVMLIGGTASPNKDTEPLNTVQSLDLSTGILTTEASLNDERQFATAVVVGEGKMSILYVLGGWGKENLLDSVERWDPTTQKWSLARPMISKRTGLATAVLDNTIYVVGGRIGGHYTNTMEAFSLYSEKWERKASMKEAKAYFSIAAFKGFLYAVAGSKVYLKLQNSVEKYDPRNDSWVTIANVPETGHVGVSSLGNRLICAGGYRSKNVVEYDDENDKWLTLANMHTSREGVQLIELSKEINNFEFDW